MKSPSSRVISSVMTSSYGLGPFFFLSSFSNTFQEPFYFAAAPYVHGILENQLKRMDQELAELLEDLRLLLVGGRAALSESIPEAPEG